MLLTQAEIDLYTSNNAKEFVDKENQAYDDNLINAQLLIGFSNGFINGVYGEVAIPVVAAGAIGLLGSRVRNNIWWACCQILDTYNALSFELMGKLAIVYAMNHPDVIAGKIASTWYFLPRVIYKRVIKFKFKNGSQYIKGIANPASLAIVSFIQNRRLIESLESTEKLFIFLYVVITGDNFLTFIEGTPEAIKTIERKLTQQLDDTSISKLDSEYQDLSHALLELKKYVSIVKLEGASS